MTHLIKRLTICAALSLGTSAASAAPDEVRIGADPAISGGTYSTGGGITVALESHRTTDGRIAICGVWAQSQRLTAYVRRSGNSVLAKGSVRVNGQTVHRDLTFLNRVVPAPSYLGSKATCIATQMAWREGARVSAHIPRHVVVQNRSGSGSGQEIRFIPRRGDNPAAQSGSILPSWITGL